jgi:hypothetical protein
MVYERKVWFTVKTAVPKMDWPTLTVKIKKAVQLHVGIDHRTEEPGECLKDFSNDRTL